MAEETTYVDGILEDAMTYFTFTGEEVDSAFLQLLINAVVDGYKAQRNYPEELADEVIDADVTRYFTRKRTYIATQVIPAVLAKVGAEGISLLIDNQVTKDWKGNNPMLLPDVVPYCGVV